MTRGKSGERRTGEEPFRRLVENLPDVVFRYRLRPDSGFEYVSHAVTRLVGYTPDELHADPALGLEIVHPGDRDALRALFSLGRPAQETFRWIARGGRVVWAELHVVPVLNGGGTPVAVEGIARDVTDRWELERRLRELSELMEAIFESLPVAVVTTDREGRVTSWNAAAERVLGWRANEVLGRVLPWLPAEEREAVDAVRRRALAGEVVTDLEGVRVRKGGERFEASVSLAPLRDAEGRTSGLVSVIADVSDRKRAERALHRADSERRRLLERIVSSQEEERRRIAADLHDDTVQVLTALSLRLEMLSRSEGATPVRADLAAASRTLRKGVERLRHLMFELRPRELDDEGLVGGLRLYLERIAAEHGLGYELQAAVEPPAELRGPLYRIVQEAVTNVVKHARASRVSVTLREKGGQLLLRVADDGVGLDLGQVGSRPGHLGLVAVRERTEMLGGRLRLESRAGSGTVVECAVPLVGPWRSIQSR